MSYNSTLSPGANKRWVVALLYGLEWEAVAAVCCGLSLYIWVLGWHHRQVAAKARAIDFYRPA